MSGGLMLRLIILVSTLAIASTLAAAPVRLTEGVIRQSLVGSLLEIDTPLGVAVPVRISADGLVSGKQDRLPPRSEQPMTGGAGGLITISCA